VFELTLEFAVCGGFSPQAKLIKQKHPTSNSSIGRVVIFSDPPDKWPIRNQSQLL